MSDVKLNLEDKIPKMLCVFPVHLVYTLRASPPSQRDKKKPSINTLFYFLKSTFILNFINLEFENKGPYTLIFKNSFLLFTN